MLARWPAILFDEKLLQHLDYLDHETIGSCYIEKIST
jgi:hypothetical protein